MFQGVGSFEMATAEAVTCARRPCPGDFDRVFVRIGRLACEEHYQAGRNTITRWLEESGKDRLIAARAEHVRTREPAITRSDMQTILRKAFPVRGRLPANPRLVRQAAQFLRIRRNGGWIVSPAAGGDWWLGSRKVSAAELVARAKMVGFEPNLRGQGQSDVDCAQP